MTLSITWHPDAESEFGADIEWYDGRAAGLGEQFEAGVLDAVAECADSPLTWAVSPGWERESLVRSKGVGGFPYRVVYLVQGEVMTIVAVAHLKRRPGYWRDRLASA